MTDIAATTATVVVRVAPTPAGQVAPSMVRLTCQPPQGQAVQRSQPIRQLSLTLGGPAQGAAFRLDGLQPGTSYDCAALAVIWGGHVSKPAHARLVTAAAAPAKGQHLPGGTGGAAGQAASAAQAANAQPNPAAAAQAGGIPNLAEAAYPT